MDFRPSSEKILDFLLMQKVGKHQFIFQVLTLLFNHLLVMAHVFLTINLVMVVVHRYSIHLAIFGVQLHLLLVITMLFLVVLQ